MIRLAMAFVLWMGLTLGVAAQDNDIEATISEQISAFQADDFETAFAFASPSIQGIFETPENFGLMVRKGFPMVWRPDEVRFLELREIAGRLWQKVQVRDLDGHIHLLDYQMVRFGESWKINGVQILKQPGASA